MDELKPRIGRVLPGEKPVALYCATTAEYLRRNPELLKCERHSLDEALVDAALLGLELGAPFDLAEVIPFKNQDSGIYYASLVVQYRGHMALVYRSGVVEVITAKGVYSEDLFEYEFGTRRELRHVPTNDQKRGELVYAYALAQLKGGASDFEVITRHDAEAARKDSPNSHKPSSLWRKRPAEMWCKTAIKRLANRLPRRTAGREAAQEVSAPAPEFGELLKAIGIAPDLYRTAINELKIEFPSDTVSIRATLALMRRLHKEKHGAK